MKNYTFAGKQLRNIIDSRKSRVGEDNRIQFIKTLQEAMNDYTKKSYAIYLKSKRLRKAKAPSRRPARTK